MKLFLLLLLIFVTKISTAQLCEGTTVVLLDSINYNVPVNIEKTKGVPDETTPFPNSFDVDYVRYYSN